MASGGCWCCCWRTFHDDRLLRSPRDDGKWTSEKKVGGEINEAHAILIVGAGDGRCEG